MPFRSPADPGALLVGDRHGIIRVVSTRSPVLRTCTLLLGLPLAALTLVVLIDAIPNRLVTEPIYDAIVDGTMTQSSYSVGFTGGLIDEFSECKRMTVGLGAPEGMSTFESAVRSPTLGPCETAVPKIKDWAQGDGPLVRSYDYYLYWNGSTVLLRPTVAAFGVAGTRLAAAMALIAVTIACAVTLGRRVGRGAAAMLLAPLLLTTDYIDLPGALVHAIGMIVALGGAALMLRSRRCIRS